MDEQSAIWEILQGFTNEQVLSAYKATIKKYNVISLGTSLGIAVGIFLFIKESGEILRSALGFREETFNRAKVLAIFRPAIFLVGVVAFYPYVLQYIEEILSNIATSLGNYESPESSLRNIWKSEALQLKIEIAETSDWAFGQKMFLLVNQVMIMTIKPLLILLEQDSFTLFLMLRYMYLILLQLFGGVAIACYLSNDTKVYFYSWLKHMLFCYCMVGVFGIANFFADTALDTFIGSNTVYSYNILVIVFGIVIKLFLFKQSFNLLKSSIF